MNACTFCDFDGGRLVLESESGIAMRKGFSLVDGYSTPFPVQETQSNDDLRDALSLPLEDKTERDLFICRAFECKKEVARSLRNLPAANSVKVLLDECRKANGRYLLISSCSRRAVSRFRAHL